MSKKKQFAKALYPAFCLCIFHAFDSSSGGKQLFLESLYENRKVHVLEKAYMELDRILQQGEGFSKDFPTEAESQEGKETAASKYVRFLTEKENISIIVMDDSSDGGCIHPLPIPQSLIHRLSSYIFGKADEDTRKILNKGR